jgi:hypothetical protein
MRLVSLSTTKLITKITYETVNTLEWHYLLDLMQSFLSDVINSLDMAQIYTSEVSATTDSNDINKAINSIGVKVENIKEITEGYLHLTDAFKTERDAVCLAGRSADLRMHIALTAFTNTNKLVVDIPSDKSYALLDKYMDNLEMRAYSKQFQRDAIKSAMSFVSVVLLPVGKDMTYDEKMVYINDYYFRCKNLGIDPLTYTKQQ